MSTFAITARFPLGVYQAHKPNGETDPFPQHSRLFSALVAAAHTGTTAELHDGQLEPGPAARKALSWLETHSPDTMYLPPSSPLSTTRITAYRNEGTKPKEGKIWTNKTVGKRTSDGMAVAGPFRWSWDTIPDADIVATIDELCNDVPCLGETSSPAVLTAQVITDDVEDGIVPTHVINHEAEPGAPGRPRGTILGSVATRGRYDELQRAHEQAYPAKKPSKSQDRHGATDKIKTTPIPTACVDDAVAYEPIQEQPPTAPWQSVLLLPIRQIRSHSGHVLPAREISQDARVMWCTKVHKATMSAVVDSAPPIITGNFAPGHPRPANRVGFNYLPPSTVSMLNGQSGNVPSPAEYLDHNHGAFMVLIPDADHASTLAHLSLAYSTVRQITTSAGIASLGTPTLLDATQMWKPLPSGHTRTWVTMPAAMPETRRQKVGPSRRPWSLADSAALSVAFVCKDNLPQVPRGLPGYLQLIDQITSHDVEVWAAQRLAPPKPGRYAHKLPRGVVADPYRAHLTLGSLVPNQAAVAIGQTRHLGGGLLYPQDLCDETVALVRGNQA